MAKETGVWLREGDLLYTLESAGFHKGKETFRNRISISIKASNNVTEEEVEKIFALIKDEIEPTDSDNQS